MVEMYNYAENFLLFSPPTSNWSTVWKVWWQVRHLWLLRPPLYPGAHLRRVQLWVVPGTLCDMWRTGRVWCLLLQGVYHTRKRCEYPILSAWGQRNKVCNRHAGIKLHLKGIHVSWCSIFQEVFWIYAISLKLHPNHRIADEVTNRLFLGFWDILSVGI